MNRRLKSKSVNYGNYVLINTTGSNVIAYDDNNLVSDTMYSYKISASNCYGDSSFNYPASVPIPGIPNSPSNLTGYAQPSSKSIYLSWTNNSFIETGFEIYKKDTSGTYQLLIADNPIKMIIHVYITIMIPISLMELIIIK